MVQLQADRFSAATAVTHPASRERGRVFFSTLNHQMPVALELNVRVLMRFQLLNVSKS